MSTIRYRHSVNVWRRTASSSDDTYGRPIPGTAEVVATVPAWVQALSQQERTDLSEGGAVRLDCLIFVDPPSVGLSEADALETVAGGGQAGGDFHYIDSIEDPDGTGSHLEVYTRLVKDVEAALVAT